MFKYIETYQDTYILFKYEYIYIFRLPFCSAVARAADLHFAHPAVSSSGDRFAQGFGGRGELPLAPRSPSTQGRGSKEGG